MKSPQTDDGREEVELRITDLLGREIMRLPKGSMAPGSYRDLIRMEDFPPGSYLCHIRAGAASRTLPFVLITR